MLISVPVGESPTGTGESPVPPLVANPKLYRRLPSLLYRGLPNPHAGVNPVRLVLRRPADLEFSEPKLGLLTID
jgi:hypothetical protein